MGFFDGGFGGLVGGVLQTAGSLIGSHQDRNFARAQANADRAFQREVFQNQLQWKAADAKKAGLHPLAALGGGAYSASPSSVSVPGSSLGDGLGKLGEGIGDAFAAYKSKDERAVEIAIKELREEQQKNEQHTASVRLLDAQTEYYASMAMESARRAFSYTTPRASGREYLPGQVDSGAPSLLGGKVGDTYTVRNMGGGLYDINFSPAYQQEIGDETGQLVNLVKAFTRGREGRTKIFGKDGIFGDRDMWRNPETGQVFQYDEPTGYWRLMGWTE